MADQTGRPRRFFVNDTGSSRRPVDLAIAVLGGLVAVLSMLAVSDSPDALDATVREVAEDLPGWVASIFDAVYAFGALYAVVAVVLAFVSATRRGRLPITLLLAAGTAVAGVLLCSFLVGAGWPDLAPGPVRASSPDTFPTVRVAATTAVLLALRPWLVLAYRRLSVTIVVVQCIAAWVIGTGGPTDVIGALGVGMAAAGLALVLIGSPAGHPDLGQVARSLADLGIEADDLAFAERQPWGTRVLHAVSPVAGPVVIKVYGRDATDAHRAARWWRTLVYRDQSAPDATRLQLVEHEALVTILAERAGVAVPSVLAAAGTQGDAVLVLGASPTPLGHGPEIDDAALRATWAAVARLQDAGLMHGRLILDRIGVADDGSAVLSDFSEGRIAATEADRNREVAILLDRAGGAGRRGARDRRRDRRAGHRTGRRRAALPPARRAAPRGAARAEREGDDPGGLGRDHRAHRRPGTTPRRGAALQLARPHPDDADPGGGVRAPHDAGRARLGDRPRHVGGRRLGVGADRPGDRPGHRDRRRDLDDVRGHLTAAAVADGAAPVRHQDPRARGLGVRRPARAQHLVPARYGEGPAVAVTAVALDAAAASLCNVLVVLLGLFFAENVPELELSGPDDLDQLIMILLAAVVLSVLVVVLVRPLRRKVVEAARSTWDSFRVVTASPSRALLMFGTNLASLLITAVALSCMVEGLYPGVSYTESVFVVGAAALFSALIPVPGNVGVGEAALAAGLVAVGVPSGPAFAIAVTQRIATSYLPPIYGGWALRWLRKEDYID